MNKPLHPNPLLNQLFLHQTVWKGYGIGKNQESQRTLTRYPELNQTLPIGGWSFGLNEILCDTPGIGELQLVLPNTPAATGSVWIDPPWQPFGPSLNTFDIDTSHLVLVYPPDHATFLWSIHTCLRSGQIRYVLAWPPHRLADNPATLRKWHMAATEAQCVLFIFRPLSAAKRTSPASLRLALTGNDGHLHITILKCKGHLKQPTLILTPHHQKMVMQHQHISASSIHPNHPSHNRIQHAQIQPSRVDHERPYT